MNPMQLLSFAWISNFLGDFSQLWSQAETMAFDVGGVSKGQATTASMKAVVVGVVLVFLTLIIVANFAPEAYDAINGTNVTDVPGGDFLANTGILLVMLLVTVVVILAVLDLI